MGILKRKAGRAFCPRAKPAIVPSDIPMSAKNRFFGHLSGTFSIGVGETIATWGLSPRESSIGRSGSAYLQGNHQTSLEPDAV